MAEEQLGVLKVTRKKLHCVTFAWVSAFRALPFPLSPQEVRLYAARLARHFHFLLKVLFWAGAQQLFTLCHCQNCLSMLSVCSQCH